MAKDDKIISNISYSNSDFRSIYPELLTTAKVLSNKWDPSTSNESDPGVVLLKENALVADKNNYHADKNILEAFPLSCTQTASARQLYDLAGYSMGWYKSAICNVKFALTSKLNTIANSNSLAEGSVESIVIKAGTQLVDSTGEYIYTTLKDCEPLTIQNKYSEIVPAIQGSIVKYEINGDSTITLDKLDENLRLYFPETMIAQNGIFIMPDSKVDPSAFTNSNPEIDWIAVDNLNAYPAKSKIFKFGVSASTNSCYIQFPEDIALNGLIGAGLNVYYTISQGISGEITNEVLSEFNSDVLATLSTSVDARTSVVANEYIKILNYESTEASDPETLTQAYNNYKKTIGIFDTLVTRRDYEGAIYNIQDDTTKGNLVSNAKVTDRTNDINGVCDVIHWDLSSVKHEKVRGKSGTEELQPYDITLYLLQAPLNTRSKDAYLQSFDQDNSEASLQIIQSDLDNQKSAQHEFSYPKAFVYGNDIYNYFMFNNVCQLNGTLTPLYKITSDEAKEIEDNVRLALFEKYNSREIDFGNELEYNDLIDTIKNSDTRIRNVALDIPIYQPYLKTLAANSSSISNNIPLYLLDNDNINNRTIARMVLAGHTQLFKFNEDFQKDFGQSSGVIYPNTNDVFIKSITTWSHITFTPNAEYTVQSNDLIQIITPSLATEEEFSTWVHYKANFNTTANVPYVMVDQDKLKVQYTDPNTGTYVIRSISGVGKIIVSNIDITPSTEFDSDTFSNYLRSGQFIAIKKIASISLAANSVKYYLITNNQEQETTDKSYAYKLSLQPNTSYVLQENEYLIYTDLEESAISILGSGTGILNPNNTEITLQSKVSDLDLDKISTAKIDWSILSDNVTITENNIINLSQGDSIQFIGSGDIFKDNTNQLSELVLNSDGSISVDHRNTLKEINSEYVVKYKYKNDDEGTPVDNISVPGYKIQCQSRLMLNANTITSQTLISGLTDQNIEFTYTNGTKSGNISGESILFNYPVILSGGNNIDVKVYNTSTKEYGYKLKAYAFTKTTPIQENTTIVRRSDGILTVDWKADINAQTFTTNFTFSEKDFDQEYLFMLPFYVTLASGNKLTISGTDCSISLDNNVSGKESVEISNTGNYILYIKKGANLKFKVETLTEKPGENVISFKYFKQRNGWNSDEIEFKTSFGYQYQLNDDNKDKIISAMKNIDSENKFDWSYKVPDADKVLYPTKSESYFDINHIYNQFVLPRIDFDNSHIKINASSII